MHKRLIDSGVCADALGHFLDHTNDIPALVEQLKAHIPYILKHNCITDTDLMSLVADKNFDFSPAYKDIFIWSVRTDRWEFLDWFLRRVDVSAEMDEGLYHAARNGRRALAEVLLRHGASPSGQGGAPLRYAAAMGHADVVSLLLGAGCNAVGNNEEALRLAKEAGHRHVVALFSLENASVPT